MKIILGGGLVALLARDILGPDWVILPVGKSRFYSFNPPLAEDYIISSPETDDYMAQNSAIPTIHKIGYSYKGEISLDPTFCLSEYLKKLYGNAVPHHASAYYSNTKCFTSYGSCYELYHVLCDKFKNELQKHNTIYGKVNGISLGGVYASNIETDKTVLGASSIISTVPLHILLGWIGISHDLLYKNEFYYHIRTNCLDFEGATQLFVADSEILFHKVVMINKFNYIFHSTKRIEFPGRYFMKFMNKFDLIAETTTDKSICCGDIPHILELNHLGITCMGSTAIHDDCLDISSCIKRLLKLK